MDSKNQPNAAGRTQSRRRYKFLLLILSVGFSVAGFEIVLRVFFPRYNPNLRNCYVMYPGLLGDMVPNQDISHGGPNPQIPVRYSTNEHGLRATEPLSDTDHRPRILFLGDSYMEGTIVDDQQTLPRLAAAELAGRGIDACCINAACSGYTMEDYLSYCDDNLHRLSPAVVVISFTSNDYSDSTKQEGNRAHKRRRALDGSYRWWLILRQSAIIQLINRVRVRWFHQETQIADVHARGGDAVPWQGIAKYNADLEALLEQLASQDAAVCGLIFCDSRALKQDEQALRIHAHAAETFTRFGIAYVDALAVYRASGCSASQLFGLPLDNHPAVKGYEVLVQPLCDLIIEKGGRRLR